MSGTVSRQVAHRYAHETRTDFRGAKLICATYEHGRNLLAEGDLKLYTNSRKLHRRLYQAIQLVVVDEVHDLAGDRGPVVSCVLALCRLFEILVLIMSGTVHDMVSEELNRVHGHALRTIRDIPSCLCEQIALRIDDEKALLDLLVCSIIRGIHEQPVGQAWAVFVRTVRELSPRFIEIMSALLGKLRHFP
jgi:hypothetical protein